MQKHRMESATSPFVSVARDVMGRQGQDALARVERVGIFGSALDLLTAEGHRRRRHPNEHALALDDDGISGLSGIADPREQVAQQRKGWRSTERLRGTVLHVGEG